MYLQVEILSHRNYLLNYILYWYWKKNFSNHILWSILNKKRSFKKLFSWSNKGLIWKPVSVTNFLPSSLSYINLEFLSNCSLFQRLLENLRCLYFFTLLLIPASLVACTTMSSTTFKSGWINCVKSKPIDLLVSVIFVTPIPLSSRLFINALYLLTSGPKLSSSFSIFYIRIF